jgi:hypothetical protein
MGKSSKIIIRTEVVRMGYGTVILYYGGAGQVFCTGPFPRGPQPPPPPASAIGKEPQAHGLISARLRAILPCFFQKNWAGAAPRPKASGPPPPPTLALPMSSKAPPTPPSQYLPRRHYKNDGTLNLTKPKLEAKLEHVPLKIHPSIYAIEKSNTQFNSHAI